MAVSRAYPSTRRLPVEIDKEFLLGRPEILEERRVSNAKGVGDLGGGTPSQLFEVAVMEGGFESGGLFVSQSAHVDLSLRTNTE
jgi:hypothetical protein